MGCLWKALIRPNKKNVCFWLPTVPKLRSPTLIFILLLLNFCNQFLQKNVFSFCFHNICVLRNTSADVKLLANEKEEATSRDTMWQTEKMLIFQFWFYKKYFRQIKLFQKIKKIILPTYPNFKKHVTGNTHVFFVWP